MKRTIIIIIVVCLTLVLPFKAMAVQDIVITSGTAAGTWYPVSIMLADILEEDIPDLRVSVIMGGGAANPGRVNEGRDARLGYTYAETFMDAYYGRGEFEDVEPMQNLRAMLATSITNYSIIVPADSDIWTVEDLLDQRFGVALPGQGPELLSRSILEIYGYDYDDFDDAGGEIVHTETAEMAGLMRDGHIDALATMGPVRHSIGIELEAYNDIRVVSLDEEKVEEFLERYPGFAKAEIPANTYNGHEEDALSIGSVVQMIVHKDVPDDLVYEITKTTIEKGHLINEEYEDYDISLEGALRGLDEEYFHSAALEYIKGELDN